MIARHIRPQGDRALDRLDGQFRPPLLVADPTQQAVRFGVVRVPGQRRFIDPRRVIQLARVLQPNSFGDLASCRLDCRHCRSPSVETFGGRSLGRVSYERMHELSTAIERATPDRRAE